jgi:multidrug efflux pump subunit AcrA (membrane-fusion protein)
MKITHVGVWLLFPLLFACGREADRVDTDPAIPPRSVVEVQRRTVVDRYEASGALYGEQTARVTSKVTGYLTELRAEAGDPVSASQILGVIDAPELAASLRAAESALDEAKQAVVQADAGLEAASAQAEVAAATFTRFQSLRDKRAVTRQEFDEVEARHKAATAQSSSAEAGLARARSARARAEAEVAAARALFEYTRVRAPFDGRVLERQIDLGNLAAPGATLFVLEKEGPLRAEVSVEESMAGRIRKGDRADILLLAHEDEPLEGTVTEVIPRVDVMSRTFRVKVELPAGSQSNLVAGTFVRVRFAVGETERLLAPRSAIVRRGQLSMVYAVEEDGPPKLRLVTLGEEIDDHVEVLSGLSEGDRIVSEPSTLEGGESGDSRSS